jgi:hypothetical protein
MQSNWYQSTPHPTTNQKVRQNYMKQQFLNTKSLNTKRFMTVIPKERETGELSGKLLPRNIFQTVRQEREPEWSKAASIERKKFRLQDE